MVNPSITGGGKSTLSRRASQVIASEVITTEQAARAELSKGTWCATQAIASDDDSDRQVLSRDAKVAYQNVLRLLGQSRIPVSDPGFQEKLTRLEGLLKLL